MAGLELRSLVDAAGLRPCDYAARARNPVLVHLLDERLPVSLLRQIWVNYSLEQSMPSRHQTLSECKPVGCDHGCGVGLVHCLGASVQLHLRRRKQFSRRCLLEL